MPKYSRQMFNGQWYNAQQGFLYPKSEATSKAKQLRKEGWLVRVKPEGTGIGFGKAGAKKIQLYRLWTRRT